MLEVRVRSVSWEQRGLETGGVSTETCVVAHLWDPGFRGAVTAQLDYRTQWLMDMEHRDRLALKVSWILAPCP